MAKRRSAKFHSQRGACSTGSAARQSTAESFHRGTARANVQQEPRATSPASGCNLSADELECGFRLERLREVISLAQVAAELEQALELPSGLDPLSYDAQSHLVSDCNDHLQEIAPIDHFAYRESANGRFSAHRREIGVIPSMTPSQFRSLHDHSDAEVFQVGRTEIASRIRAAVESHTTDGMPGYS
jgi:hypothetical protein